LFTPEDRLETAIHILAHFIAAGADRRTSRCDKVRSVASKFARERPNRSGGHAGGQATPPGVRGSYSPSAAIRNEQGHAVGDANRQGEIGIV
jgi:hypothetical protein